ncbi:MAG TPA: hypothetical protein VMB80_05260, partial [Candidatus Acidoferrum sp.]|nr:hypothetical protein [Candidatus Acidoferrum sp.]
RARVLLSSGCVVFVVMKSLVAPVLVWLLYTFPLYAANERINQEGRLLGPPPTVTDAILFNTSNADAVVSAVQIFPATNPWNECVSNRPVLVNSDAMIAQIVSDLGTSRAVLTPEFEMNFVLVPDSQPRKQIAFFNYADESDLDGGTGTNGLYPIPTNLPIETWPAGTANTLLQWQTNNDGSDRHAIMVAPGGGFIWETWETTRVGTNWEASNGAKFNLNTNGLRPAGWTSGDAAGLPMFPALVRFDEAERSMVEHACRIVVKKSRYQKYLYPATHYAAPSGNTSTNLPQMGQRLRLKAGFVIPLGWTKEEKAVLLGLKKYGALVADNGNYFSISVTPDDRWPAHCFDHLTGVSATNFEVVQSTGTNEGPRSAGAPVANAGPDRTVPFGQAAALMGFVSFSNSAPVIQWRLYSGPGTVTFGNATQTNTTATFSAPGIYTLELSADDGIHAVAYDAAVMTVANGISMTAMRSGMNLNLSWTGGTPPFVVERAGALPLGLWNGVVTTSLQNASVPMTNATGFFRVRGQ